MVAQSGRSRLAAPRLPPPFLSSEGNRHLRARRGGENTDTPGRPHPIAERPRSPTGLPEQAGRGGGNREAAGGRGGRDRASGQGTAHRGGARPRASCEETRPGRGGKTGEEGCDPHRRGPGRAGPSPAPARRRAGAHPGAAASSIGTQRAGPSSPQDPRPAGSAPARSLAAGEKSPPVSNEIPTPLAPTGQRGYPVRAGSCTFCPMETRLTLANREKPRRRCGSRQRALGRGGVNKTPCSRLAQWAQRAGGPAGGPGAGARRGAGGCRHAHVQGEALPQGRWGGAGGAAALLHVPPAQPPPPPRDRRVAAAAAGRSEGGGGRRVGPPRLAGRGARGEGRPARAAGRGTRPRAAGSLAGPSAASLGRCGAAGGARAFGDRVPAGLVPSCRIVTLLARVCFLLCC